VRTGEGEGIEASGLKSIAALTRSGQTDAEREILQQMHRDLLEDAGATELAHQLYERLGGMPAPSLSDWVAAWQAQGEALRRELDTADAAAGKAVGGLRTMPPDLPNGH
jgi:hypothetical protein